MTKVMFRPEVREQLMVSLAKEQRNWGYVEGKYMAMAYHEDMLMPPYFVVSNIPNLDRYYIESPSYIKGMEVEKQHVQPYIPVNLSIEEW